MLFHDSVSGNNKTQSQKRNRKAYKANKLGSIVCIYKSYNNVQLFKKYQNKQQQTKNIDIMWLQNQGTKLSYMLDMVECFKYFPN